MADPPKDSKSDQLSRYTLAHVRLMRPRNCPPPILSSGHVEIIKPQPFGKYQSLMWSEEQSSTAGQSDSEVEVTLVLSRFTVFLDLPVEIQDQIWKLFIESNPRLIRFATMSNPSPILCHINKQLRLHYRTYGYVELKQTKRAKDFSTIFHPDIDLLYLPREGSSKYSSPDYVETVVPVLKSSGALRRMRNIAFSDMDVAAKYDYYSHFLGFEGIFLLASDSQWEREVERKLSQGFLLQCDRRRLSALLAGSQSGATLFRCPSIGDISSHYNHTISR